MIVAGEGDEKAGSVEGGHSRMGRNYTQVGFKKNYKQVGSVKNKSETWEWDEIITRTYNLKYALVKNYFLVKKVSYSRVKTLQTFWLIEVSTKIIL